MKSILYIIIQGGFEIVEDNYLSDKANNADWSYYDWQPILVGFGAFFLWLIYDIWSNRNNKDYKGPFRD
jgi:hypothetical protein